MDVIYLNGPSCAGKTTLAHELQARLPDYYLHIGIDTFIEMMPAKANRLATTEPCDGFSWETVILSNGETGTRIRSGPFGKRVNSAFHAVVSALLQNGHKLIVDDVADGAAEVNIWRQELSPYALLTVGVFCSLAELRKRENARADRKTGSAIEQFHRVHHGVEYDISVHTDVQTPAQCSAAIVDYLTNARHRS